MMQHYLMLKCGTILFAATLLSCASLDNVQSCLDNGPCRDGHFCDTSTFQCHKCLSCSDLKRHPPLSSSTCIKSVRECGPCLEGLVPDRRGNIDCELPSDDSSTPTSSDSSKTFIWIGAGIFIALLFVAAVGVMYRFVCRQNWIKFNVDTNIGATLPTHVVASAPECPPPPYSPANPLGVTTQDEETSQPLIKSYQPPFPTVESQDFQNVSVFNPPAYVRLNNGPRQPEEYNRVNDVNDNYCPSVHTADTTPTVCDPPNNYTDNSAGTSLNATTSSSSQPQRSNEGGALVAALAIARNTDLNQPPLPVTLRLQTIGGNEDANSGDKNSYTHAAGSSGRTSRSGSANIMNVNQIFNIIKP